MPSWTSARTCTALGCDAHLARRRIEDWRLREALQVAHLYMGREEEGKMQQRSVSRSRVSEPCSVGGEQCRDASWCLPQGFACSNFASELLVLMLAEQAEKIVSASRSCDGTVVSRSHGVVALSLQPRQGR